MRVLAILFFTVFTNGSEQEKINKFFTNKDFLSETTLNTIKKDIKEEMNDSVKIIASKFIWFNEYSKPNKYVIEEPDIEDFYKQYPKESKKYFPLIREEFRLDFNEDFFLRCYIFMLGNEDVFSDIDFSKLDEEQKRIAELNFRNFNIHLK